MLKVPTTTPSRGQEKERIIGQNASMRYPLKYRMSWTKKKDTVNFYRGEMKYRHEKKTNKVTSSQLK